MNLVLLVARLVRLERHAKIIAPIGVARVGHGLPEFFHI